MKKPFILNVFASFAKTGISAMIAALAVFGLTVPAQTAEAQTNCYTFQYDLKIGSTGVDVEKLHEILSREGFSRSSSWSYNNTYTEETASLVSGFQEKYRSEILTPLGYRFGTGYVGTQTRNKLSSLSCGSGSTNNQAPTISNFVSPTTLRVSETGTWSMTAYDPQGGQLYYSVKWGDEIYGYGDYAAVTPATTYYSQQSTFTHAYSRAGTYTVMFKVRDAQGYEAQVSGTVVVGGGSNNDTSGITITTTPNKSTYNYNEIITFTIAARNNTAYEKVLSFNSGCQVNYRIGSYDSGSNQACTLAMTSVRIPAYGTYTWNQTHSPSAYQLPQGTYTLTGRVIGYSESNTTITVGYGGVTTGALKLLTPNGGQYWRIGSYQTINWQLPYVQTFLAQAVDVNLIPQYYGYPYGTSYGTGTTCPIGSTCAVSGGSQQQVQWGNQTSYPQTYNILRNSYTTSYNWYVGYSSNSWSMIPAGTYIAEVCLTGTSACDRSDSVFTIY